MDGSLLGKKILLIENDPAVIDAMSGLLDTWGCVFRIARDTKQALEALDGAAWVPDLVIADQQLDHGDLGTLTLEALTDVLPKRVPAILATADGANETVLEALRIGAEHMAKPIKPAQLRALVSHLVSVDETAV